MIEVRNAIKEGRKEYRRFDWNRDREETIAEIHRLTEAGVSAATIGRLIGMSDRNVQRIRSKYSTEPARASFDRSPARAQQLDRTADAVLDLACMLRDEDPQLIWDILCRLERQPLQEMAVIALAAIAVDRPKTELFEWIEGIR